MERLMLGMGAAEGLESAIDELVPRGPEGDALSYAQPHATVLALSIEREVAQGFASGTVRLSRAQEFDGARF